MDVVDWTYIGCGICCVASDETTAGALDTTAIGFSRITRRFFNGVVNPFGGGGEDEDEEDECSPTPCPPLGCSSVSSDIACRSQRFFTAALSILSVVLTVLPSPLDDDTLVGHLFVPLA